MKHDDEGVRALREAGIPVKADAETDAEPVTSADRAWAGIPLLPDEDEERRALRELREAGEGPTAAQRFAIRGIPFRDLDYAPGQPADPPPERRRLHEHTTPARSPALRRVEPDEVAGLREAADRQVELLRAGRPLREVLAVAA